MQAIDTNVLVYAEIRSSAHHDRASRILRELAQGSLPWAIPWPCIYEFLRVVTHPRVYHPAMSLTSARRDLDRLLASPTLVLLHETSDHQQVLSRVLDESGACGNLIHDAHIAALCLEHGISVLISGDRDFARFPSLSHRNPFG